jgi:hypothetical protein
VRGLGIAASPQGFSPGRKAPLGPDPEPCRPRIAGERVPGEVSADQLSPPHLS